MKKLLFLIITGAIFTISCKSQIRVVQFNKNSYGTVALGTIENRNSAYQPFVINNFIDMLSFEMRKKGFRVCYIAEEIKPLYNKKKKDNSKISNSKSDKNQDLLDSNIDKLLIEHLTQKPGEYKPLTQKEIAKVLEKKKMNYFIQGSLSQTQSGLLMDAEINTLLFLNIYNKQGEMILAVNYMIQGEGIANGKYLQKFSEQVATALYDKTQKSKETKK